MNIASLPPVKAPAGGTEELGTEDEDLEVEETAAEAVAPAGTVPPPEAVRRPAGGPPGRRKGRSGADAGEV